MVRKETKASVLDAMCDVGREALAAGNDAYDAIAKAFPGAPGDVVAEAWVAVENEATQAWWEMVEKTIDGEVVKNAIREIAEGEAN